MKLQRMYASSLIRMRVREGIRGKKGTFAHNQRRTHIHCTAVKSKQSQAISKPCLEMKSHLTHSRVTITLSSSKSICLAFDIGCTAPVFQGYRESMEIMHHAGE
jgi:hypothetical protein